MCIRDSNSNAADVRICNHCQTPRSEHSKEQQTKRYNVGEAPKSGDMTFDEEPDLAAASLTAKPATGTPNLSGINQRYLFMGLGAIFFLCTAIFLFRSFSTSDITGTVQAFEWERQVEIEALQTFTEEDWSLPTEARLISQQEAIHHFDQVIIGYETKSREVSEQVQVGSETYVCGQRDLGNGFFEDEYCEDPVYETRYRTETYEEPIYENVPVFQTQYIYEIDRWEAVRTVEANGNNRSAEWPDLNLGNNEREGERTEQYTIIFRTSEGADEKVPYENYDEWRTFDEGDQVTLVYDGWGELREIQR